MPSQPELALPPEFVRLDGVLYSLEERIGSGGSATIYRGRESGAAEDCAIKVVDFNAIQQPSDAATMTRGDWVSLRTHHVLDPRVLHPKDSRAREILSDHPNVVGVGRYGINELTTNEFVATMELCDHPGLLEMITKDGALPPVYATLLFRQVASALQAAHDHGMIHNDVTTANVLMKDDYTPLLTDFALVQAADAMGYCTWNPHGSRRYQAPEAFVAELSVWTDQYSLAVVMYEMLTGRLPFMADESTFVVHLHQTQPVPSLAEATGEASKQRDALLPVLQRALSKDPHMLLHR